MSRWIAVALAGVVGCSGGSRYLNPSADLSAVRTVAVLPFENLTGDRLAAERIHRVFMTQLLMLDAFTVLEPGQVVQSLRSTQVDVANLTSADYKRIGAALKVDALFLGSVVQCVDRPGTADGSSVTVQFRLVEAQSGATLWSVSQSRKGGTVGSRLFGGAAQSSVEVAEDIAREELAKLVR